MKVNPKFYTYLWLREDGSPYYVGKGSGNRAYISRGHVVVCPPHARIVIHPAESESEAFDTEVSLVWYYGRKDLGTGILRNLTNGGEGGIQGIKPSEETRKKMKEARIGRKLSAATRLKISMAVAGKKRTEETIRRISEGHKGTNLGNRNAAGPQTVESRRLRSKALKGKPWSEARRAAQTLDVRLKMSLSARNRRLRVCQ